MTTEYPNIITIETIVKASIEDVWEAWTNPISICKWNHASDDWHTTKAENDLQVGGKFSSRMEAKDGSFGFDFFGIYDYIQKNKVINYTMGDGRKAFITFSAENDGIKIVESFEAENENPIEMQRFGWLAILENFKKYVETK